MEYSFQDKQITYEHRYHDNYNVIAYLIFCGSINQEFRSTTCVDSYIFK